MRQGIGDGQFITFEGIDGSGKSTQARLLAERLRADGRDVVLTREPGGSPGAEEIRQLLLTGNPDRWSAETEILLFTAARRDHLEKTIRPALDRGAIVICDRFADSTRVYQGATRGELRGTVDRLHELMIGQDPDLTFVIDMDPRDALERAKLRMDQQGTLTRLTREMIKTYEANALSRLKQSLAEERGAQPSEVVAKPEDRYESFGLPFQETLRQGFLRLVHEHPRRCVLIDGNRAEEAVATEIAAHL